ncbi:MAG: hypothetical protein JWM03_300 [Rhodocyclales bacterium]|nr:hypothetical protein [Rhodocyclales bacterium]
MKYRTLFLAMLAGALASCATHPPQLPPDYVAPNAGPLARIQVRSNQVAGYGFFYSFDDQRNCKGNRMIAMTKTSQSQLKASTSLRADEPASLWFSYAAPGNRFCNSVRTFKPASGKNYLAYAVATDVGCSLSIQDITDPANPKFEPSFFTRTYVPTIVQESAHCVATDVDAQIAKARKPNLSGLKMDDLKALLPPATSGNVAAPMK